MGTVILFCYSSPFNCSNFVVNNVKKPINENNNKRNPINEFDLIYIPSSNR